MSKPIMNYTEEDGEEIRSLVDLLQEHDPVPCNGCSRCCKGDAVAFIPGDDPTLEWQVEYVAKVGEVWKTLKRKSDNHTCFYLREGVGCSIYDRRPTVCKGFDCRRSLLRGAEEAFMHQPTVMRAGLRRLHTVKLLDIEHEMKAELDRLVKKITQRRQQQAEIKEPT